MRSARLSGGGGSQSHLVAGRSKRVDGVAIATLTALATGQVPGVGSAAVAVLANHVGLAGTLAAVLLALAVVTRATGLGSSAWHVAHALCTECEKFAIHGFSNLASFTSSINTHLAKHILLVLVRWSTFLYEWSVSVPMPNSGSKGKKTTLLLFYCKFKFY